MEPTEEQQRVISYTGNRLIVKARAGTGKHPPLSDSRKHALPKPFSTWRTTELSAMRQ